MVPPTPGPLTSAEILVRLFPSKAAPNPLHPPPPPSLSTGIPPPLPTICNPYNHRVTICVKKPTHLLPPSHLLVVVSKHHSTGHNNLPFPPHSFRQHLLPSGCRFGAGHWVWPGLLRCLKHLLLRVRQMVGYFCFLPSHPLSSILFHRHHHVAPFPNSRFFTKTPPPFIRRCLYHPPSL